MKVGELIEILEKQDRGAEINIAVQGYTTFNYCEPHVEANENGVFIMDECACEDAGLV